MKQFLIALSAGLLMACGGTSEEKAADFSNITFALDTVVVDQGEEIINLKQGLWVSVFSEDKKYLYHWDQDNALLEKVNLDEMVLEEKLPFEKEGPNGVGDYISWISLLGEDQILFSSFQEMGLFDFKGEKLKTYKLNGEKFEGDTLQEYESFTRRSIITNSGNDIFGILGNWTGKSYTLGKVNYEHKTLKKHQLEGFEKLADYAIMLRSPEMMMISPPDQAITEAENRLIISNSVFNSLYLYDLTGDSLFRLDYNSTLTKNSKTGKYLNEVESKKDFDREMNAIRQEINFQAPIWDSENKRFYRFSYETIPKDEPLEEGQKPRSRVFLTIFDEDFNILGESLVSELQHAPSTHFAKDGKIWIYENIDDELGFVRLSFN